MSFFKGLGLGLLCLLCFAAGLAFVELLKGPDDTLAFSRSIELGTELKPDFFSANINFNANENLSTKSILTSEEKAEISASFEKILELAKKRIFVVAEAML